MSALDMPVNGSGCCTVAGSPSRKIQVMVERSMSRAADDRAWRALDEAVLRGAFRCHGAGEQTARRGAA
jgi:hypothetical protein